MNSFGIFGLFAGGLQLTIPSYGLRLVRRFGTARVGWFLVIAFLSLALMHIVRPGGADSDGSLRGVRPRYAALASRTPAATAVD